MCDRDPAPIAGDRDSAAALCRSMRAGGRRLVFTNGCFDVLHAGHVHLLREAASFGDVLVVGLNSDESVRGLNGPSRPLQPFDRRASCLAAVRWVDLVARFDEPTPLELIEALSPDVLVKGGDYDASTVVGAAGVIARGGEVRIVPLVGGLSTTSLLRSLTGER